MTITELLSCGAMVAVITLIEKVIMWLLERFGKRSDSSAALKIAVGAMLRDRIQYLCKGYIKQGHISLGELEDLEQMYKAYSETLGLNHVRNMLITQVRKLPIQEE